MAKHRISFNAFSASSIKQAQFQLMEYKRELVEKCEVFVRELAKVGIQTAQGNLGAFGKYIVFRTEVDPERYGCRAVMVASNSGLIKSEWYIDAFDNTKTADVSPILMAEFGSGLLANNPRASEFGMGTGTFPDQKHAEDPGGWWYVPVLKPDGTPNEDREWFHSEGVTPTMPMQQASSEIIDKIRTVAKQVFV